MRGIIIKKYIYMFMKCRLLFFAIIFLLPACVSPKRYAGFIRENYKNRDFSIVHPVADIQLRSDSLVLFDSIAKVRKGETYFIPAIIYWGIKQSFYCELNPKIPINIFSKVCKKYADSLNFNGKLNGQRLEISINALPSRFIYKQSEDVLFLLIAGFTLSKQVILPYNNNLELTYKLYNGSEVARTGHITAIDINKPVANNWKSTKKMTLYYLGLYERNMRKLSEQCMVKLAREL